MARNLFNIEKKPEFLNHFKFFISCWHFMQMKYQYPFRTSCSFRNKTSILYKNLRGIVTLKNELKQHTQHLFSKQFCLCNAKYCCSPLTAIETEMVYKLLFNLLKCYTLVLGCLPGSKSFPGEVSMAIQSDSLQHTKRLLLLDWGDFGSYCQF